MSHERKRAESKCATGAKARRRAFNLAAFGAILALALLFKVFYLWSYSHSSPYFAIARLDSGVYVDWAREINRDGRLGTEVFYQAPLYPYFLSVVFSIFGESFPAVTVIQLLMGAGIVCLVYLVGKRAYGERAGLISAALCLGYAPFTMLETKILTTVTEMFLGLGSMYLLVRAEQERSIGCWAAGGAVLGLAVICRPNYLPVVPLVILILLARHRHRPREATPAIFAVGLIPCLIVGVVAARNYAVGRDFVPISSSAGVTFAQGNNAMARGAMVVLPGFSGSSPNQRREETLIAEKEMGRPLKPSETSAFWFRRAFEFIREHPGQYLRLLLDKVLLVFNNRELGNNYLMSVEEALTPALKLAFIPFGFIMAWAVIGLVPLIRPGAPRAAALLATFLGTFAMLVLFYVSTRFRMPLATAAVIMAGGGIATFLDSLGNARRAGLILAAAAALFIVSLPPFLPLNETRLMRGDGEYWANLAVAFEKQGQCERALRASEKAIAINPESYRNHAKKTELLDASHADKNDVIAWARQVAEKFPGECSAHLALADLYRAAGKNGEAIRSYRKAVALRPREPEPYLRLGALLGNGGDHRAARAVLAEGLKVGPADIRLQYDYAVSCAMTGDREEALKWLREVASREPGYARSRELLRQLDAGPPESGTPGGRRPGP